MTLPINTYRVSGILAECARLQRLESRWENHGIAELMSRAVERDSVVADDPTVIVLCRLLFRDKHGGPLRVPMLGQPGFLGSGLTTAAPDEPLYLFRGVPFYVVWMYGVAGLPEASAWYLAYCLRHGVWNPEPYPEFDEATLRTIVEEFIVAGPWEEELRDDEIALLRQQVS